MVEVEQKSNDGTIEIPVGRMLSSVRKNPWIVSTVVLGIALIVMIIVGSMGNGGGLTGNVISVGENEAGSKLISFIDAQGGGQASLISSVQEGSLYKVTVGYQNQTIPVYVTLDGKYLITQPISLSATVNSSANTQTNTGTNTNTNTNTNTKVDISVGDSPALGSKTAKVTVVEFADFSCPFCAAASGDNEQYTAYMKQRSATWEPIVTNLIKDYVNTGKVLFVSKYAYGHTGGHPAQLVAWCLNEQNPSLFWKFYPIAYANQSDVEDLTKMKTVAQGLGADMTKLQACLDSNKYNSRFDQDQAEATQAGVSGTPAFFVNGKLFEGAVPYSDIKAAVDAELNSNLS